MLGGLVQRHTTVDKNVLSVSLNKTLPPCAVYLVVVVVLQVVVVRAPVVLHPLGAVQPLVAVGVFLLVLLGKLTVSRCAVRYRAKVWA